MAELQRVNEIAVRENQYVPWQTVALQMKEAILALELPEIGGRHTLQYTPHNMV